MLSFYKLAPIETKKFRPSAGNAPGPGYPPALLVKYLTSATLLIPAFSIQAFRKFIRCSKVYYCVRRDKSSMAI